MHPGEVVAARFELEALAGQGGMGAVYRAVDRTTGQTVALKVLTAGPRSVPRFAREARILESLVHPAIVEYVAHGQTPAGDHWLATEWLEGEDLSRRFERRGLALHETVELGQQLARALGEAHRRGIVHRDVKPSNVLLVGGDPADARLLDFGIARSDDAARLTHTGSVVGTPAYMAPEQARGLPIDARADLFSLGCVLYECLAGRCPFDADQPVGILVRVLLEEPTPLAELRPDVPEELAELVHAMLAKDPEGRPPTANDVASTLASMDLARPSRPGPEAISPPRSITTSERHLLTVVLAGGRSVGVAETLELEGERSLAGLRDTVEGLGGLLDALPDGSLCVTLTGTGRVDHLVARAARCALELRQRSSLPVAIATGTAEVSHRFPVGEVIDRALALLDAAGAPDGQVRLDEVTAGLLPASFALGGDAIGLVLLGEVTQADPVRTVLGRRTPLVGRAQELGMIEALADACFEEDAGAAAVMLVGEPGSGKSRLRVEAARRLAARYDRLEIWMAGADPVGAGSPLGVLDRLLSHALGLQDGEPPEVRRAKMRARIARHLPEAEVERTARFLSEVVGILPTDQGSEPAPARDPAVVGDQIRMAFERLLEAECSRHPLLLVIEDLHWGDRASLQILDGALRRLADRSLMVLATARPEVDDTFEGLWAERNLQRIRIGPLRPGPSAKLVRDMLADAATDEAVERIVERATGNAFFLEELVRAEVEAGGAVAPGTLLAVLQARLERMAPEARRVLRAASVTGRSFWRGGLLRLLGQEARPGDIDRWLEELEAREVIETVEVPRLAGERELRFRHDLMREAAYAMLTDEDRRVGHRLAGEWLEEAGERDPQILANHLEMGGLPHRAVPHWTTAAQDAMGGNDLETALAAIERAVAAGPQGDELARLRALQAECMMWRGRWTEGVAAAREALAVGEPGSPAWSQAAAAAASLYQQLVDRDALKALVRSLQEAAERNPSRHLAQAMVRVAANVLVAGDAGVGRGLVDRAERMAPGAELDADTRGWAASFRAFDALGAGDIGTFLAENERAQALYDEAGNLRRSLIARLNVGFAHLEIGAYQAAAQAHRELAEMAEPLGLSSIHPAARSNLGAALLRLGLLDEARQHVERAIASSEEVGDLRVSARARIDLAMLARRQGRLAEARAEAQRAIEMLRELDPDVAPHALAVLAGVELAAGRVEHARRAAAEAMEGLAERGGLEAGESAVRLAWAEVCDALGDRAAAREAVDEAWRRIEARASRITAPALRATFLGQVEENVRLGELRRLWAKD